MDFEDRIDIWHVVAKQVASPSSPLYFKGLISCIFLSWPLRKLPPPDPQHSTLKHKLPRNFKKGVQLVWRRTILIYTQTEEDSSNDAAFDLALLANIPPFSRQVRCLPMDVRKLSGTAKKVWEFLGFLGFLGLIRSHTEFWRYQSSPVVFVIAFGLMMLKLKGGLFLINTKD